ncbi:acylneuraminate cytidylyltransferase family protein [Insolitispirillum peregrinum]|uniref:N-acylneuraminate cytidylyltransferase n=1 Tax=Insolitispirillum peregrinum TaxID=80876 RepID=A0A1N7IQ22_9PROT|nr:hypothetical protein [Insolitispirillum peregrinum]SIS39106.1 N-acylneuraminate cytidylyltransferase [Insolitispirillum peregrinum]
MNFSGTIAHIPARGGSKRVPKKNLRLMAGQPMMSYAVREALLASGLDAVYVNTDDADMAALGEALGAKVHHRPPHLAVDEAGSDDFNAEIISTLQPQTLVMINPVCPLITAQDIEQALQAYRQAREADGVDTLIAASMTHMQTFCEGKPVNVSVEEGLRPSQENPEVAVLNWAVSIWDAPAFLDRYQRFGFGVWGSRRLLYRLPVLQAAKVSDEGDFLLCEALLLARRQQQEHGAKAPVFWAPGQPVDA